MKNHEVYSDKVIHCDYDNLYKLIVGEDATVPENIGDRFEYIYANFEIPERTAEIMRERWGNHKVSRVVSERFGISIVRIRQIEDEFLSFCRRNMMIQYYLLNGVEKTDITLEDDISCLQLKKRSYNALKRSGIDTIGELCNTTKSQLLGFKKLGAGCTDNIITQMKKYGFELKPES